MPALEELEEAYAYYKKDKTFKKELKELFKNTQVDRHYSTMQQTYLKSGRQKFT